MAIPLYKVGDKVKVLDSNYGNCGKFSFGFVDEMVDRFGGKVVTISKVLPDDNLPNNKKLSDDGARYHIVEDDGRWNWASSMFYCDSKSIETHDIPW